MRQIKSAPTVFIPPLIVFACVCFFISLGDGIMSYLAPVVIQNSLNDTALVGLILSISSFFGMFLDIVVAQNFFNKSYRFFISKSVIFALLFPLAFLFLPHNILVFALSMIIWSVYYDFLGYSRYNFIYHYASPDEHTKAWSTLVTFDSIAYMIGPGLAIYFMGIYTDLPFYLVIVLLLIGALILSALNTMLVKKHENRAVTEQPKRNLILEFRVMGTLLKKLWILVGFSFILTLIDVSIWTIGILYAEQLRKSSDLGDTFMIIYGAPSLFIGIMVNTFFKKTGKKRMAYTAGALAGLSVLFMGLSKNIVTTLAFVFIMSTFYGISAILLNATVEDYVARIKGAKNDIVSLLQFTSNLAYSVGPIILGFAAKYLGFGRTFVLLGGLIVGVSVLAFILTPLKIKLPQKEISTELTS